MAEYFLGLIAFAFFGSVILSLLPEGFSKKYARLLCGLCAIVCVAFPLFEVAGNIKNDFKDIASFFEPSAEIEQNAVEIYNNSINTATLKNVEESLKNDILKGNSVSADGVDVRIVLNNNGDEFYIKEVRAYIYPSGYALDPKKINEICKNKLGTECNIIYK
jgi:hypothetical protein